MTDPRDQVEKQEVTDMNRDPITGSPGAHPVGTGVGAASGAVAGAAIGLVGGPIGSAVGGVVGAVVGGLAGKGVGEVVNPTGEVEVEGIVAPSPAVMATAPTTAAMSASEAPNSTELDSTADETYWQRAFITEPYFKQDLTYDDYGPAYRAGIAERLNNRDRNWAEAEDSLRTEWERSKGASSLNWEDARDATHAAWHRADNALAGPEELFEVH